MLEVLTKKELISLIGEKLYEGVADFLEKVYSGSESDEDLEIYKKKNIIRLLLSFSDRKKISKAPFWQDVLSRLKEPQKKNLEAEGINVNGSGNSLVKACLEYELRSHGIPSPDFFEKTASRPAISVCCAPLSPFKSLKDYQTGIFQEAKALLETPRSRFIIQMPTGSGKTRTAMEIVASQLNSREQADSVIWLAHSVDLIEQAATCFEEVWGHIGSFDISVRIVDSARSGLEGLTEDSSFIVSTFQSLTSFANSKEDEFNALAESASLIICDEAHMTLAPTYHDLVSRLLSKGSMLVGLTATPGRDAVNSDKNKELAEFYFNKIVDIPVAENRSVFEYLRTIGVMSYASVESIQGTRIKLTNRDLAAIRSEFTIPETILKQLASEELRNIEIIMKLRKLISSDDFHSVILFACSVEHSKFITAVCTYLGISSAHVDGKMPQNRRHEILNRFRDGDINLLSNYGVLSTGFDAPKTDVVFIARPTASVVLYSQMIGRGLRGPEIGGTQRCKIIDVIDNLEGLPNPDEIHDYFAEYYSEQ